MTNSNNQIKVSVIVTCFNLEQYISRAIRSCLNQTMPDDAYEVIVVDDASSDSSRMAIQSFGSQLIKPIFLDENVGVAGASNIGIRAANGKYIIRTQ